MIPITWNNPANITYGTQLSSKQLNARASVPGSFAYNPLAGTILSVGQHKLNTLFTPTDSVNYTNATASVQINVLEKPAPPVADFSSNVTSGAIPLTVSFTDTSTGIPTSWKWTFGDGASSTAQNPVKTYSKAGSYNVALTVKNALGKGTETKKKYITVYAPPVVAFSAYPLKGKAPLTVAFTDKSKELPNSSWSWTFGDGNTSTVQHPVNIYSKVGKYSVTLTVTDAGGTGTTTKVGYVTVK